MVNVTAVRYVSGHTLHLTFSDGSSGEVDLSGELDGPVFEALREPAVFAKASVHPELRTVVWPNGADLAPEFLRSIVRVPA